MKTAAVICGGFSFAGKSAEIENGAFPPSQETRHRHQNKKAGTIRPFVIRLRNSASTSVVKGKAELQPD
ncbi:hypothetical protein [Rhizobium freirei]|uniref:hypothetical protein n=1 Tax=Rhizobium freirei TaxID=1353277 RepID=UPI0003AA677C|nr:hypothetical protein [Rhizobium freirei]